MTKFFERRSSRINVLGAVCLTVATAIYTIKQASNPQCEVENSYFGVMLGITAVMMFMHIANDCYQQHKDSTPASQGLMTDYEQDLGNANAGLGV